MPQKFRREAEEAQEIRPEPIAEQDMERDLSQMIPSREVPSIVTDEQEKARQVLSGALDYFEDVARTSRTEARRERG